MRRIAAWLGVEVPAERWAALVEAATFAAMRERAQALVPDAMGVLKDHRAFFRKGRSGAGGALLSTEELSRYHRRAAEMAPPDLLAWLHRGRWPVAGQAEVWPGAAVGAAETVAPPAQSRDEERRHMIREAEPPRRAAAGSATSSRRLMPDPGPAEVADPGDHPAPLASGRDADVFVIDDRRVLRRYREGGDVAAEAAVMAYVASHGFPVPTVYQARGADLVMERLDGPTMLSAFLAGELDATDVASCLADLHQRLHALPPRLGECDDVRILHLDLHPENVMLTSRGPVVIDWRNATEGPADLDVAFSAVILAQVAVEEAHPLASSAATLLDAFIDRVGASALTALDQAVAIRRDDPALTTGERERLGAAAALIAGEAGRRKALPGRSGA
ncbi:phosphotransferase [Micromonospora sp. DSM 115977]|uniref:Phosphotransferase n=1 Tax=Micromonospora reichwaldensis TaxID=3075516 RepID=A0ABU2X766_9ACTN|nr:phosphotransferase [Micromonospora sp. DSM 115977]MDT0533254.1 phosphotransferase [Micromonospora sp. DSM 115977]